MTKIQYVPPQPVFATPERASVELFGKVPTNARMTKPWDAQTLDQTHGPDSPQGSDMDSNAWPTDGTSLLLGLGATYWAIGILCGVALTAMLMGRLLLASKPGLPYQKRESLLTDTERAFCKPLREAIDHRFDLHCMVRMADLLQVKSETPDRQSWQNRILAKHIDFVLCDEKSLEPLVCIELDDPSHQRPDRVKRDQFVNRAFAAAGLPLLRIPTSDEYSVDELREQIDGALG